VSGVEAYDVIGALTELGVEFVGDPADSDVFICCPFHDDEHPSCHVNTTTGWFKCFSCDEGGGFRKLVAKLVEDRDDLTPVRRLSLLDRYKAGTVELETWRDKGHVVHAPTPEGFLLEAGEVFDASPSPERRWYEYADEVGNPVGAKSRGIDDAGRRRFTQYHYNQYRTWVGGAPNIWPLYNLRAVIKAVKAGEPIYLTEGEKDADWLTEARVTATTCGDGSGSRTDLSPLTGADVVVVADRDEAGWAKAVTLSDRLSRNGRPATVSIVRPTVGKDVADHLFAGLGVDDLVSELIPAEQPGFGIRDSVRPADSSSSRIPSPESTVPYVDFRDVHCTPDEWLLDKGRAVQGEFNLFVGIGGSAKTTTAAGWIAELTLAGVKVLYLGERSLKTIKKRLTAAGADFDYVKTFDLRQFDDIHHSTDLIEHAMQDGFSVLVLDPINHFIPIGTETHQDGKLRQVTRRLSDLMADGKLTVIGLHHMNKNESGNVVNRLMGSAFFRDYPANVLGMGVSPKDEDQRAVVLIKTNSDDGVLEGALIYAKEMVELEVDGHSFNVARSVLVGHDPDVDKGDVFKPQKREPWEGGATEQAREGLLEAKWVPTNSDAAQDEDWYSQQLEAEAGIRLDPKNVGKLLTKLYEWGFNYLSSKPGKGGYKKRYWRKSADSPPAAMSEDDLTNLDDDIDKLLGDD
jgi:AAA domain/CHC2 zinc finger